MDAPEILSKFIVLEGLDGSGTTTQLHNLANLFINHHIPCSVSCEPTDGPIGRIIRDVLEGRKTVNPYTLAYLFAGDRNEHLTGKTNGILKDLSEGKYVITDRYIFSSLAYQSVDCGYEFVHALNCNFPLPEHLFYIDVPVRVSQERMKNRTEQELFDREKTQKVVQSLYERSFAEYGKTGMNFHRIDGALQIEEITDKIWNILGPSPPI